MKSDISNRTRDAKSRVNKYIEHINNQPSAYVGLIEEAALRLISETNGVTADIAATWMLTFAHLIRESIKD